MNKTLVLLAGVMFALLVVGTAYAAGEKSVSKEVYGNCVSENAKVKNTCFNISKETLKTCKASVPEGDGKKEAMKQCKLGYKEAKKQCKAAFKTGKGLCVKAREATESLS